MAEGCASSWLGAPSPSNMGPREPVREGPRGQGSEPPPWAGPGCPVPPQVCDWKEPEDLRHLLDLELRGHGEPQPQVLQRCRDIIRYSVKTCR